MKTKYIRTSENAIIIFSELQMHSDFIAFKPISAGFINIKTLECYGDSYSLRLHSLEDQDSKLAKMQFNDNDDNCDNCGKDLENWVCSGTPGVSQYCEECTNNPDIICE